MKTAHLRAPFAFRPSFRNVRYARLGARWLLPSRLRAEGEARRAPDFELRLDQLVNVVLDALLACMRVFAAARHLVADPADGGRALPHLGRILPALRGI